MKREQFPLTAAQKMIYRMRQEYAQPQVTCLGVCMMLQGDFDFDLLRKCIQMEFERYDCLRLRFTPPDEYGSVQQYLAPYDRSEIKEVDLSGSTMEAAEDQMKRWTRIPFERTDAAMCEFILVKLPEGYQGIYLRIDHLLVDSYGIIALANDVMELYCHFMFGTPEPRVFFSFFESVKKDLELAAEPVRKQKDEMFWEQLIRAGEPIYTDVKGLARLEESRRRHGNPILRAADRQMADCREGQVSFYLRSEQTAKLLNFCSENRVSMTNLFLMGLRTYLSRQNGGETDISIRNYVSRRSSRLEKRSGGSRVFCFPCRTVMEPGTGFLNGIKQIQQLQNEIYRHANYDSEKVIQDMQNYYHAPHHTIYESVALTYQPIPIRLQNEKMQGIPYRTKWFSNGIAIQPVYLTVMHSLAESGLEFYVKYQAADYEYEDIRRFYEGLVGILMEGIARTEGLLS